MAYDVIIPQSTDWLKRPRETSPYLNLRDPTAQNQIWKMFERTGKRVSELTRLIQMLNDRIAKCERWGTVPMQPDTFFPFKIYQPGVTTQTQCTLFGQQGSSAPFTGAACTIDPTNPTNLGTTPPTINPTTDAWRFFAVRNGLVEYRAIYNQYVAGSNGIPSVPYDPNNWGYKFGGFVSFITNSDRVGIWPDEAFDETNPDTAPALLAVGINPDGANALYVQLWIQIVADSLTSAIPTFTICGTCNLDNSSLLPYAPIPGPLVIPLGQAIFQPQTNALVAYQETFDHINNRYPGGNGNFGGISQGTLGNIRGNCSVSFDTTQTQSPADLAQQIFYPGDLIWYWHTNGSTFDLVNNGIWMFTGPYPAYPKLQTIAGQPTIPDPSTDANFTVIYSQLPDPGSTVGP